LGPRIHELRDKADLSLRRWAKLAGTLDQVGGDAGGAESMIADLRLDAGGFRPPLDHAIGILLVHGFFREGA
jgi:hypothetical protein